MAFNAGLWSFDWATTDAAATAFDHDFGFVPKGLIVWASTQPGGTDAVGGDHVIIGRGVWANDVRRHAFYFSADGQGNQTLLIRHGDDAVIGLPDTSAPGGTDTDGSLDVEAQASWPTTTTVRLLVDTQLQAVYGNLRVFVLAFGGDDITNIKVGDLTEPGSTGTQNFTDPGFQPTGMMVFGVGWNGTINNDNAAQGMFTLGMTDGTRSWVAFNGADDNTGSGSAASYAKSGELIAMAPDGGVAFDGRASVTAFSATGIDLNWSEATAGARKLFYLAWAGGQFRVDSFSTRTDTTPFSGPTAGFTPTLAQFVSVGLAESTADTPSNNGMFSSGAAVSATDRFAAAFQDVNGPTVTNCGAATEFDEVYINLDTSDPPAVQGLMDINTWADPLSLVMDDADPSAAFVGVALMGATPSGVTLNVPAGSLTLSGLAPTLAFAAAMGVGALSFQGYAPSVRIDNRIQVPAGAITLTGYAPTVVAPAVFNMPVGSLSLQGYAPTLDFSYRIEVPAGSLTLTGQTPSLDRGFLIPAGAITLQGQYVAVAFGEPTTGAIVIQGYAPSLAFGLNVPAGAVSLQGQAPSIQTGVAIPVGALALQGYAPTLNIATAGVIIPDTGAVTLQGYAPTLQFALAVPVGSISLEGQASSLAFTLSVGVGTLTLQGYAPSINGEVALILPVGALELQGYAPRVELGIQVPVGSLSFQGYAPAVQLAFNIVVPTGSIVFEGYTPSTDGGTYLSLPVGAVELTGYAPSVGIGINVPAGSLSLEGSAPSMQYAYNLHVEAGTLSITGYAVTVYVVDQTAPKRIDLAYSELTRVDLKWS